jgi:hypothetical protein
VLLLVGAVVVYEAPIDRGAGRGYYSFSLRAFTMLAIVLKLARHNRIYLLIYLKGRCQPNSLMTNLDDSNFKVGGRRGKFCLPRRAELWRWLLVVAVVVYEAP